MNDKDQAQGTREKAEFESRVEALLAKRNRRLRRKWAVSLVAVAAVVAVGCNLLFGGSSWFQWMGDVEAYDTQGVVIEDVNVPLAGGTQSSTVSIQEQIVYGDVVVPDATDSTQGNAVQTDTKDPFEETVHYSVTFRDLYGNVISSLMVEAGQVIYAPLYTPQETGLVFQFWYDAQGVAVPYSFGTQIWKNLNLVPYYLYAQSTTDVMGMFVEQVTPSIDAASIIGQGQTQSQQPEAGQAMDALTANLLVEEMIAGSGQQTNDAALQTPLYEDHSAAIVEEIIAGASLTDQPMAQQPSAVENAAEQLLQDMLGTGDGMTVTTQAPQAPLAGDALLEAMVEEFNIGSTQAPEGEAMPEAPTLEVGVLVDE